MRRWIPVLCFFISDLLTGTLSGQTTQPDQIIAVQPRITQRIDESKVRILQGNTHPLARAQFDRGAAPASLAMNRMLMVLQRSPEQEAALRQLLDDQQDKSSPNYHQWMTPELFGQKFGPADADVQAVTAWLQVHGFQVASVSKGRTVLEFSGNAGQVQEAFHTPIHKFVVEGEEHWANARDPEIPAALTPAVGGVLSLHNFRARPLYHDLGVVSRSKVTGTFTPVQPLFSFPGFGGCGVQASGCYVLGPYDFATIYNVLPLWTASPAIDGTGQTIAIVGETDIGQYDVLEFRRFFGLPTANLQIIYDGPEPGIVQGDETESDIDVEWSGAVAPGAAIDFVVAQSTETTQGIHLSALHIIDNNLAPIMSESYGQCELYMGAAGNQFLAQLWQQAAAEGITALIASGDSGSAVCDRPQAQPPVPAKAGLQVSGYSSTPYNVAVGGTDFNDLASAATYWSTTNNPTTEASAKSYIPESTWNDSCTNALFGTLGYSTIAETNCNNSRLVDFVAAVGGSGGRSSCVSSDGKTPSSCAGGYPKPSWQSALTPNDGARDVPDVSLFAGDGLVGSFYLICELDRAPNGCAPSDPGAEILGVGGTSVSAPAFAGIMALVNQQTGSRQGNANYVLYKLAKQQPNAFHDVTSGTIAMPCQTGSPNCTTSTVGDAYGVLGGYNAVTGYDLATGLGSVDAFNLVTKWNSVTLLPSVTTLASLTPTTITHGQPVNVTVAVAPQSGAGTPTGLISLVGGPTGGVVDFDNHLLTNSSATWTTSLLPGGSYNVAAHYPGDGNYGSSDSATSIPVVVNRENSTVALGLVTLDPATHLISNTTTAAYGSPYILRIGVTGTTCPSNSLGQAGCPTGNVSLIDNGNLLDAGTFALNNLGYTEDQTIQLSGGSHTIQATYAGDNSFNPSTVSAGIVITPAVTTLTATSAPFATVGVPAYFNSTVLTTSSGVAPTGTVTFLANGSPLTGTLSSTGVPGSTFAPASATFSLFTSLNTPGPESITARYSGDSNYAGSTSTTTLNLGFATPSILLSPASQSVQAGNPAILTAFVDTTNNVATPTGTVLFQSGLDASTITGNVVYTPTTDTNGNSALQAQLTFTPAVSQGVYATYAGDANYGPVGSFVVYITVVGNDFVLLPSQPSLTATKGSQVFAQLQIVGQSAYNGTVSLTPSSCTGLPAEASCAFNPASITGSGTVGLQISTTGVHPASVRGPGVAWATGLGTVACLFLIGSGPRKRRCAAWLSLLTICLLLALPSCGGGSNSGGDAGGGGGSLPTDPGTPVGTYTVTVTATSGSLTHTANFQLIVQ